MEMDELLSDEQLNENLRDATESKRFANRDVRQERLEEYETSGMEKADPLQASLTGINAILINLTHSLSDALANSMAETPLKIENVGQFAPVINDIVRTARQIDRFVNLDIRIENAQIQAQLAKSRGPTAAKFLQKPQDSRRLR